ncbi:hypothetical protein EBZ80_25345, partial [bacterium]|nr:hypothetical protein [bacterium]
EVDTLSGDSIAVFRLPVVADQSITTVVSGTYANATYRVPFRALVRVSPSVSSTDVAVWYGGGGDVVTIHAGSWMSARRVTLYD